MINDKILRLFDLLWNKNTYDINNKKCFYFIKTFCYSNSDSSTTTDLHVHVSSQPKMVPVVGHANNTLGLWSLEFNERRM